MKAKVGDTVEAISDQEAFCCVRGHSPALVIAKGARGIVKDRRHDDEFVVGNVDGLGDWFNPSGPRVIVPDAKWKVVPS